MNIRRLMVDIVGSSLCWIGKRRVVRPSGQVVKVNLGSGLTVAPDWINVDASLNAFFSKWPRFVLRFAYKLTNSNKSY